MSTREELMKNYLRKYSIAENVEITKSFCASMGCDIEYGVFTKSQTKKLALFLISINGMQIVDSCIAQYPRFSIIKKANLENAFTAYRIPKSCKIYAMQLSDPKYKQYIFSGIRFGSQTLSLIRTFPDLSFDIQEEEIKRMEFLIQQSSCEFFYRNGLSFVFSISNDTKDNKIYLDFVLTRVSSAVWMNEYPMSRSSEYTLSSLLVPRHEITPVYNSDIFNESTIEEIKLLNKKYGSLVVRMNRLGNMETFTLINEEDENIENFMRFKNHDSIIR